MELRGSLRGKTLTLAGMTRRGVQTPIGCPELCSCLNSVFVSGRRSPSTRARRDGILDALILIGA